MTKFNMEIRNYAKQQAVWLYQIADELNIRACELSVLLRYPLTEEKQTEIKQAIDHIVSERGYEI